MQLKVIFAALAICAAPGALAEDHIAPPKRIYFLIDASDSMDDPLPDGTIAKTYADAILEAELRKLITPNSRSDASINFFSADPKSCDAGTATVERQIPIPTPIPKSPNSTGATNLGAVLEVV